MPQLTDGLDDLRPRGLSPTPTCSRFNEESIYKAALPGVARPVWRCL
jgi:hypothetical protein